MDKVHTSPSKTIARGFFTINYFCLFECAGHQSEWNAQLEELKMEKTIYRRSLLVGWTCLAGGRERCPRAGATQLL